jgi:hypothetical protein
MFALLADPTKVLPAVDANLVDARIDFGRLSQGNTRHPVFDSARGLEWFGCKAEV